MKIFGYLKQTFISAIMFFSYYLPNVNSLSCISEKNQRCKARPEIANVNTNNPHILSIQH